MYHPLYVDVELATGETVSCRTYQMQAERCENLKLPSPFYLKVCDCVFVLSSTSIKKELKNFPLTSVS